MRTSSRKAFQTLWSQCLICTRNNDRQKIENLYKHPESRFLMSYSGYSGWQAQVAPSEARPTTRSATDHPGQNPARSSSAHTILRKISQWNLPVWYRPHISTVHITDRNLYNRQTCCNSHRLIAVRHFEGYWCKILNEYCYEYFFYFLKIFVKRVLFRYRNTRVPI